MRMARRATQTAAAAEMYPYKQTQRVLKNGDMCVDGKDGKADDSSNKNDKMDGDEE